MDALERAVLLILADKPETRELLVTQTNGSWHHLFTANSVVDVLTTIVPLSQRVTPTWIATNFPYIKENLSEEFAKLDYDEHLSLPAHIETLRRRYRERTLDNIATRIANGREDLTALIQDISEITVGLLADSTRHDPGVDHLIGQLKERQLENPSVYVPVGIPIIDDVFGGVPVPDEHQRGGKLWGIKGEYKSGKTTILKSIINALLDANVGVSYVSTERAETSEDAIADLIANRATGILWGNGYTNHGGIHHDIVLYGSSSLPPEITNAIDQATEELRTKPLRVYGTGINDGMSLNLPHITRCIRSDIQVRDYRLFILDNLHGFRQSQENDYSLMLRTVPSFAGIVAELGATGVLISQVNREGEVRGGGLEGEVNALFSILSSRSEFPEMEIELSYSRRHGQAKGWLVVDPVSGLVTGSGLD